MGDPFGREKPVRKAGTRSRASKKSKEERLTKADERALRRFHVVSYVRARLVEQPHLSKASAYGLAQQAYDDGELEHAPPSRSTMYRWLEIADDVEQDEEREQPITVRDFADAPRSGRPPERIHPEVLDRLEDMMLSGIFPSLPLLTEDLIEWAEEQGYPAPSASVVKDIHNNTDLAALSAARHGRKAARADAIAKAAVPADYPHQLWTLDELDAANWVRAYHPIEKKLVSVRPKVILIVDNFSRVPLAAYACEPFKGGSPTVGFDSEDVLGAFYMAVHRELAHEACKPYVGYMPHGVRMDAAPQHNRLKLLLKKHWAEGNEMERGAPWSRGNVESLVGRFKDLSYKIKAHVDYVRPADRVKEAQEKLRTDAAATTARVRRKAVVPVQDLPTIDEYREGLEEEAIERYLDTVHRMLGTTPEVSYFNHLRPSLLRPASDALFMIKPRVLTVGADGIEHRNAKFATQVAGHRLAVGAQVRCRPDPLRRGLFAEIGGATYFLPEKGRWAREQLPAQVVRDQKEVAAEYSERGKQALETLVTEQFDGKPPQKQQEGDLPPDPAVAPSGGPPKDKRESTPVEAPPSESEAGAEPSPPSRPDPANPSASRPLPEGEQERADEELDPAVNDDSPSTKRRGVVRYRSPYIRLVE